jgi:hypothetical protein
MSLSESCACGASFTAERDDELSLLNAWRSKHKCPKPERGNLALSADTNIVADFGYPELRIGFRGDEDDD